MTADGEIVVIEQPDSDAAPLLRVKDLSIGFAGGGVADRIGVAVDNVSFTLFRGKTLCLVGESGCGKTVTALSLLRLLPSPPARILSGSVVFAGQELLSMPDAQLRGLRGNKACMIFQDPMTSLNPVIRVGVQMTEGLRLHKGLSAKEARQAALSMLERVGIPDPVARARAFPHQLSGGMRQRAMIGMALACDPALIIADEPTTALDVTVQKQILRLIRGRMENSGSGLLLITHDLAVVAQIADEMAVMYAGTLVEQGPAGAVLAAPAHPYTQGLLLSRPRADKRGQRLDAIPGVVPGLWDRPDGCAFHPRCPKAFARCGREAPPFYTVRSSVSAEDSFWKSRCWLLGKH